MRGEIADRAETLSRIKVIKNSQSSSAPHSVLSLQPQCVTLDKDHHEKKETYDSEKRELIGKYHARSMKWLDLYTALSVSRSIL